MPSESTSATSPVRAASPPEPPLLHRPDDCGQPDRCPDCAALRGVRYAARSAHARRGLRPVLERHRSAYATVVPAVRRSASQLARHQPGCFDMSSLPAQRIGCLIGAGDRSIRRHAARHPPRSEIREATVGRSAARAIDDCQRRGPRVRRRSRRPGAAAPAAAARTRLQSGGRTGAAPGSRMEERAAPDTGDTITDRSAGREAARERPECLLGEERSRGRWADSAAGGRCVHHRRHAERVRRRAARGRGSGRPRPYCSASRVETAVSTSARTASRERSPSRRSQLVEAAA